jgi:hypothetical protein
VRPRPDEALWSRVWARYMDGENCNGESPVCCNGRRLTTRMTGRSDWTSDQDASEGGKCSSSAKYSRMSGGRGGREVERSKGWERDGRV